MGFFLSSFFSLILFFLSFLFCLFSSCFYFFSWFFPFFILSFLFCCSLFLSRTSLCFFPVYSSHILVCYSVIVVFCGRNGKCAAAKFAPFRNLLQILLLFMKNLSFHHFKTEVFFFLSDKVPKVSILPFFYFPIIVLKLPFCLKLLY